MSSGFDPADVYRLSNEAFALACRAIDLGDTRPMLEAARALNSRLDELLPGAQSAASSDPGVMRAWSDARLDSGYVLSGGQLSTSPRLAAYVAARKRGAQTS
jgi:hypothetical protein